MHVLARIYITNAIEKLADTGGITFYRLHAKEFTSSYACEE
jgi:hypothetical protein